MLLYFPRYRIFSGFISNEATLGIPFHVTELSCFRDHLESLIAEYGIVLRSELISSSDEMELFGTVNRHFKNLFNRQTECNIFYQYDNVPEGNLMLRCFKGLVQCFSMQFVMNKCFLLNPKKKNWHRSVLSFSRKTQKPLNFSNAFQFQKNNVTELKVRLF